MASKKLPNVCECCNNHIFNKDGKAKYCKSCANFLRKFRNKLRVYYVNLGKEQMRKVMEKGEVCFG